MRSALEILEAEAGGRTHTLSDYHCAREKALTDPASLTPMDLALIGFFGSDADVDRADAARRKALAPASADPTPTAPPARTSGAGQDVWDVLKATANFCDAMNTKNIERNARLDALEAEIVALKQQLAARPGMKYCGVWDVATTYGPGDAVTKNGSLWFCKAIDVISVEPGDEAGAVAWTLAVKRGKDGANGRDGRVLR